MSTSASNIVAEWLRSLQLGRYAESFLDNGYDDLEICKQVGDPDLDAIGVFEPSHRSRLLHSVRALREEGAASVYFTLEEAAAAAAAGEEGGGDSCLPQSSSLLVMSADGGRYRDEYEEGKAELVRIPRPQLRMLLRDTLDREGIRLSCRPYSTSGNRGKIHIVLTGVDFDLFSGKRKASPSPPSPSLSAAYIDRGRPSIGFIPIDPQFLHRHSNALPTHFILGSGSEKWRLLMPGLHLYLK
ncbi:sterile alpha motif domain-containing protein 5-like [Ischnura elegans]|uniref:sterile alpha motif domain-containing protein 5-like n=1 Tax=Ischnura elegans TaxID=197161 RepID=UPI001ED88E9C|nr:sterile alpha motif domain-containing protein 5-like [Ischnura elegans]